MKVKNIERIYASTVKVYVAEDGKEFDDRDECIVYENDSFLNKCADKYKIKSISVPDFICNDDHVNGILFFFPQDGDKDELIRLLSIYQNYPIYKDRKNHDKWKVNLFPRDFNNVRESDLNIEIPFELNKGDNYVFYFSWEGSANSYDYFYNAIISKEEVKANLKKEIERFEEMFGTKFE